VETVRLGLAVVCLVVTPVSLVVVPLDSVTGTEDSGASLFSIVHGQSVIVKVVGSVAV
jgi:hypothetical protein